MPSPHAFTIGEEVFFDVLVCSCVGYLIIYSFIERIIIGFINSYRHVAHLGSDLLKGRVKVKERITVIVEVTLFQWIRGIGNR